MLITYQQCIMLAMLFLLNVTAFIVPYRHSLHIRVNSGLLNTESKFRLSACKLNWKKEKLKINIAARRRIAKARNFVNLKSLRLEKMKAAMLLRKHKSVGKLFKYVDIYARPRPRRSQQSANSETEAESAPANSVKGKPATKGCVPTKVDKDSVPDAPPAPKVVKRRPVKRRPVDPNLIELPCPYDKWPPGMTPPKLSVSNEDRRRLSVLRNTFSSI